MPIVLLDNPRGNEWRGTIKPDESWDEWFEQLSRDDQALRVDRRGQRRRRAGRRLGAGQHREAQLERVDARRSTQVREIFKGQLTYSSNWDHYTVGPVLGPARPDRDEQLLEARAKKRPTADGRADRQNRWKEIQNDLLPFVQKTGKPLLFLEVGWCSLANAAHEPWDYTQTSEPIDLELQRRLYGASSEAGTATRGSAASSIWEWTARRRRPRTTAATRPKNKPAEKVLREWLAKPRWEVSADRSIAAVAALQAGLPAMQSVESR